MRSCRLRSCCVPSFQQWILGTCLSLTLVSAAQARTDPGPITIVVSNTNDSGPGSLRQAITNASSGDTISITATGTINLASALPTIDKNLTITGPGAANLTVSGGNASRVFFVQSGTVTISDLTVAQGRGKGGDGGAGMYSGGGGLGAGGGLFVNTGAAVTARNIAFTDNAAVGGEGVRYSSAMGNGGGGGLGGNGGDSAADYGSGAGGGGGSYQDGANGTMMTGGSGGSLNGGNGQGASASGSAGGDFGGGGGAYLQRNAGYAGGFGGGGGGGYNGGGDGGFGGGGGAGQLSDGHGTGGGGDGDHLRGGGGAGFGGAVFLRNGGTLVVEGTTSFNGNSVAGGQGANNGSAEGSAMYLNDQGVTFNSSSSQSVSDTIGGTGGLTKSGTGTLTLSGTNTYSGGTTVSGGTLAGNTNSLQGNITNNANVTFDQSTNGTYAGRMDGTGALTKAGTGTVMLSGLNTYSGGTTVSGGVLVGNTSSLQGSITNNANVTFDQNTDGTYAGNMIGTGSLTKAGIGTVTLSGTNGHAGGTIISGGTLRVGSNANLGNPTGQLFFNGGTLQYASAVSSARGVTVQAGGGTIDTNGNDATLSGNITGAGGLTISGDGCLTLSGSNSYSGGTTVSVAALVGTTTSLQGSITNNGDVVFNQDTAGTYAGNMGGTGTLSKTGTGAVTLSGTNTYSGGTTVYGGSLAGTTTSLQGNITNNANVTFNQDTTGTYAGNMDGTGSLTKTGTGTVTLAGANTYSGATNVDQGRLVINGSIASNVIIGANGSLGGSGSMGGTTVDGAVRPGNSIGTLTVNGAYTHGANATYHAEINDHGGSDLIHVGGTATINGGTVDVQAESGTYTAGMSYRILEAGSVTGHGFDHVTDNLPFLDGELLYESDYIMLMLVSGHVPFVAEAQTRNEFATAAYLDALSGTASGDLATVMTALNAQTAPDARAAFNQLSGEPYADLTAIDISASDQFVNTAFYRMYNGSDLECANPTGRRFWVYSLSNWECQHSTSVGIDSYAGYSGQLTGFMVGCDRQFDNVLLGCAGGYGRDSIGYITSPASDRTDLGNISCYGKADFDQAYVAGTVGYTHGWNDVTRTINISGLASRQATASMGGDVFGSLLQFGYNIDRGSRRLTPLVGVRYNYGGTAAFNETGADSVSLVGERTDRSSLTSHLGARLAFCMNSRWRAETYGQWEHEYCDTFDDVTMAFAGSPGVYAVRGAVVPRDAARMGFTTIGDLNRRLSVHVNYDALVRAAYTNQQLTGGLSIAY